MTDKIIELKNVTFRYDENQEKPTLNNISFHVKHGEWLSIIGHNGSGKSTTVRLIDGLLEAESGQILIEGHKLSEDNVWDIRHKISMVFQNPDNQFVGATVEDDIAFGLENKGIPLKEMRERVVEALNLVDMSDFKTREPARLSGGQKQRVAIAGAVAMRPSIIILDEATSMLDPEGRLELIGTIQKIREQYGMTVISITHDLDEVTLSDRVLVMKNGQIESSSSPRELFSRGDELLDLGLDIPFTSTIIKVWRQIGFTFDNRYLLEKELEDKLWALISKK
ncbi:energy-coupling factor ABC transporter ATP-binding protein [Streptococcus mutans]|uniref:energy-coupling factor ABC transporter ATP-binding protein n=1 Tax=Streptococcus mutans TaxID=1309 RepID=UPI0002B575DD|nr:energy-coupling factor ABC transporter ATP-binding protein [Streptococcus mutans]EMC10002.1 cobalt transporter ATP-binding subunit [Streptococcus mutans NLML9]